MIVILTIFHYFIAAVVDGLDKVLISQRKILPLSYAFWSVVTGLAVIIGWPLVYESLPKGQIAIDLAAGALFSLTLYVFFKVISQGEISRVVPFVFGLVPVFDVLIGLVLGKNLLTLNEAAAVFLLVPGALLISYKKGFWGKHVLLKLTSAFLWSVYFAVWQFAAGNGGTMNHFMWSRVGAAGVFILLLLLPFFRKAALKHQHIESKKSTAGLFLFKQALGGANLIFFSWLLVSGKISLINSMQGFRYVFLFFGAMLLAHFHNHLLQEQIDRHIVRQKIAGLFLIFMGTIILFK